ncbi:hypothetical protein CR162_07500 [Pseudoroseomonas rhizosphaerae]|uniref:Uncharacterized protein n=1 Tax=Teichococcus rhizosphaerae TaxID=1335062 RepID=A0A2C6Y4E6_9PROT|nr:hypothetical protein CR162_07500 [Pseudoroseomonas rhizosphaerae]
MLIIGLMSPAAKARDAKDFTLGVAIGGGVPFARKDSFLVASLGGAKGGKISVASSLSLAALARPVFEPRPLYVLGGGLGLGRIGAARLSLDGQIAAAANPAPDESRAVLGLARLRLVF